MPSKECNRNNGRMRRREKNEITESVQVSSFTVILRVVIYSGRAIRNKTKNNRKAYYHQNAINDHQVSRISTTTTSYLVYVVLNYSMAHYCLVIEFTTKNRMKQYRLRLYRWCLRRWMMELAVWQWQDANHNNGVHRSSESTLAVGNECAEDERERGIKSNKTSQYCDRHSQRRNVRVCLLFVRSCIFFILLFLILSKLLSIKMTWNRGRVYTTAHSTLEFQFFYSFKFKLFAYDSTNYLGWTSVESIAKNDDYYY